MGMMQQGMMMQQQQQPMGMMMVRNQLSIAAAHACFRDKVYSVAGLVTVYGCCRCNCSSSRRRRRHSSNSKAVGKSAASFDRSKLLGRFSNLTRDLKLDSFCVLSIDVGQYG